MGIENSVPQYVAEEAPFFVSIPTPPSSGGEFPMSNSILFLPLLNTTGSCCFLHLPWPDAESMGQARKRILRI